jgi:hypothetical protein
MTRGSREQVLSVFASQTTLYEETIAPDRPSRGERYRTVLGCFRTQPPRGSA